MERARTPGARTGTRRPAARVVVMAVVGVAACVGLLVGLAAPAGARAARGDGRWGGPLGWVEVRLAEQHAYLYRPDGSLAARVAVSTGAPGSRTPRGSFTVQRKQATTTASSDWRVHMDWFVAFKGGYGLHGIPWRHHRGNRLWTPLGQRPVSHGCVRMDDSVARWIFSELPMGARVVVK